MKLRVASDADAEGIAAVQVASRHAAYRGLIAADVIDCHDVAERTLLRRFMIGTTAFVNRNVPVRLKCNMPCHSSIVSSSTVVAAFWMIVLPPTAFTRMSTRPCCSTTRRTTSVHLRGVERVGDDPVRRPAVTRDRGDGFVQQALVAIDEHHGAALASHDLGRRAADAAASGGDEGHSVSKSHRAPPRIMRAAPGTAPYGRDRVR